MIKKNFKKLGIMQGRLLPKYNGRYQAHPIGYWKKEFPIASKLGLDSIEFILDFNQAEKNPLLTEEGIKEIKEIENLSGIKVKSICADYFMEAPIHSSNKVIVENSLKMLNRLIDSAVLLNIKDIVIPCVDQSSLKNQKEINNFVKNISSIMSKAEKFDINISLETDLAPKPFADLIEKINSKNLTVNYDMGNSAALGYDPIEELKSYGKKISDLHIKDRLLGGVSVPLGTGNVEFVKIFESLLKQNYQGIMIFQAFRDDEGLEIFKKQFSWFLKNIKL